MLNFSLTNDNFEKLRRATVRINKKEEESLNGLVLEKLRQNSFSVKKVRNKVLGISSSSYVHRAVNICDIKRILSL